MTTVRIEESQESFVIYFGTESTRINAYTLATTLVNFADAARAANGVLNPGYDIEVVVEALGSGSFKAQLRTIYRGASNLFSKQTLHAIVIGVISNFVYQHTLAPSGDVKVNVGAEEVVIEQGDTKIIVPRRIHEATKQVEARPEFVSSVKEALRAVDSDTTIRSIGFSPDMEVPPPIQIPRERFPAMIDTPDDPEEALRDITVEADLQILRAILEKSRRKWEFVWNGTRISGPVRDEQFYDDFFAHRITIAPGDVLRAKLSIRQRRLPGVGIFVNEQYEVLEVVEHLPQPKQQPLAAGE